MDDLDRSAEGVSKGEDYRAKAFGFGGTKQAQALARHYREYLADRIRVSRGREAINGDAPAATSGGWAKMRDALKSLKPHRDKAMWLALMVDHDDDDLPTIDEDTLAMALLVAGISVAEPNDLGTERDTGNKTFRDQALHIGHSIGPRCGRELALRIGAWGLEMLRDLPAFRFDGEILKLTPSAWELIDDELLRSIRNNHKLSPLFAPPIPWSQVRTGGPPDDWASVPLIRPHRPSNEAAVRHAIGKRQMDRVLEAINALQAVPFTINEHVLDFMLSEGVPPAPKGERPPFWQRERFEKWMSADNEGRAFITDTTFAEPCPLFWVALNFEFRGRIYGVSHFNFLREDRVRGLFLFAKGEPIGVEGLRWLKAHVARSANGNTWSREPRPSDLEFEDRVAWTETNLEQLRAIGEAILRGDYRYLDNWEPLPKDRYQFIAACVELVQALDQGPEFITRLPIMFDASASGMQHMLAMMKSDAGRYVNTLPGHEPDDFYRRVAFEVYCDDATEYISYSHWGMLLVLVGPALMKNPFDRAIIKAAAIPMFYGSSGAGMWDPVAEVVLDRFGPDYGKRLAEGAPKFAGAVTRAIHKLAPEANTLFKWLRSNVPKLTSHCAGQPCWVCRSSMLITKSWRKMFR